MPSIGEIASMIELVTRHADAVFITTWSHPGPKVPDSAGTRLFREILRPETVVRASGGVHDLDAVLAPTTRAPAARRSAGRRNPR